MAFRALAFGALAIGALAIGALAIGALFGALAIGALLFEAPTFGALVVVVLPQPASASMQSTTTIRGMGRFQQWLSSETYIETLPS